MKISWGPVAGHPWYHWSKSMAAGVHAECLGAGGEFIDDGHRDFSSRKAIHSAVS
ncbi:MAG: hypothetical protein OXM02_09650 [Bacteroidota bacterium]|nr:hypothetical protein [Bacteroidota bacterium]